MPGASLTYRNWGLNIRSAFPVPGWSPAAFSDEKTDLAIVPSAIADTLENAVAIGPLHQVRHEPDGSIHLFHLPVLGRICVEGGRTIRVQCDDRSRESLLLAHLTSTIAAIALEQRDIPVLHGSAVLVQGRALAIVGWPQEGKSSLAAALVAMGGTVLAEGVVPLEMNATGGVCVVPGPSGLILWDDVIAGFAPRFSPQIGLGRAGRSWCPLPRPELPSAPPLRGIIALSPRKKATPEVRPHMTRMPVADTIAAMEMAYVCRRLFDRPADRMRRFRFSGAMARDVVMWSLTRGAARAAPDLSREAALVAEIAA
jgi:hypothetical protein